VESAKERNGRTVRNLDRYAVSVVVVVDRGLNIKLQHARVVVLSLFILVSSMLTISMVTKLTTMLLIYRLYVLTVIG
jgi:hypothetical protein